jgi:AcrR family transcriptional regulator
MSGATEGPLSEIGAEQPATPPRPRRYRLGQREAAVAQNRARIIAAARTLLGESASVSGFSVDAIARQAGVARVTVYYQFRSKRGLLEALFDDLAARGGIRRMGEVHGLPEPLESLDGLMAAFGTFWAADRIIQRRVRSLAALDPDLWLAVRARDERRRNHCRLIVGRLAERYGRPPAEALEEAVNVLHTLSSFETFDTLAGEISDIEAVTPTVQRLARAALDLPRSGPAAAAG